MTIYTAITHGRDTLKEQPKYAGVKYQAFIDSVQKSEMWELTPIGHDATPAPMTAKRFKVLTHLLYKDEFTLWIDGSIQILPRLDLDWLCSRFLDGADICVFNHQSRMCAYQEAAWCAGRKLDDPKTIYAQAMRYTREGYPSNNGLSECSVILRRNTPAIAEFEEMWWTELRNGSTRDQISFDYCAWKLKMPVNHFPGSLEFFGNDLFLRRR